MSIPIDPPSLTYNNLDDLINTDNGIQLNKSGEVGLFKELESLSIELESSKQENVATPQEIAFSILEITLTIFKHLNIKDKKNFSLSCNGGRRAWEEDKVTHGELLIAALKGKLLIENENWWKSTAEKAKKTFKYIKDEYITYDLFIQLLCYNRQLESLSFKKTSWNYKQLITYGPNGVKISELSKTGEILDFEISKQTHEESLLCEKVNSDTVKKLKMVNFAGSYLPINLLSHFKNIVHLNLASNNITDEGVRKIVLQTKKIEILNLNKNFLTDESIEEISKLTELKKLYLDGNKLDGTNISLLKNLKILTLSLNKNEFKQNVLLEFPVSLKNLSLACLNLNNLQLDCLSTLTNLQKLNLDNNPLNGYFLKKINSPFFHTLSFHFTADSINFNNYYLSELSKFKFKRFTFLGLVNSLSDYIQYLETSASTLQYLNAASDWRGSNQSIDFSNFKRLDTIIIDSNLSLLPSLKTCPKLTTLSLKYCVSNDDLIKIEDSTSLTELDLSYSRIPDSVINDLKKLTNLKYLNLSNSSISDIELQSGLPSSLKILDLSNTAVTGPCFQYLPFNIEELDLSKNMNPLNLFPELGGLFYPNNSFLLDLSHLKRLRKLNLSGIKIDDSFIPNLLLPSLISLNISETLISEEGKKSLLAASNIREIRIDLDKSIRIYRQMEEEEALISKKRKRKAAFSKKSYSHVY